MGENYGQKLKWSYKTTIRLPTQKISQSSTVLVALIYFVSKYVMLSSTDTQSKAVLVLGIPICNLTLLPIGKVL